jgi:hypothetical protein
VGAAAKAHVLEHRNARVAAEQWADVFQAVAPGAVAA